jgi:hypothetical protein
VDVWPETRRERECVCVCVLEWKKVDKRARVMVIQATMVEG